MSDLRFSIVITSYNQRKFIRDAVKSAVLLRNDNKEIIVVDDGSTDGSQQVLARYGDAIRLVCRDKNGNCSVARNTGAALARGKYLVFLDGDDALLPWALDVYERIVIAKKPKMILGSLVFFHESFPARKSLQEPRFIKITVYPDYLRKDRTATSSGSAIVIDREAFEQAGGWSEGIWPMEHEHFVLTLGECGRTVLITSPPTAMYRIHAHNTVHNVPPFLLSLYKIIYNERNHKYAGGKFRRFERRALIGGYALTWARNAFKNGLYWDSVKLLSHAWPMAVAAVIRKFGLNFKRRRACETLGI